MEAKEGRRVAEEKEESGAMLEPPPPPSFPRRLEFNRVQLIGIPLLMVLPLLAMLGVFGQEVVTAHTSNEQIAMEVEYIARFRHKMVGDLRVGITNLSDQTPVTVTVAFDRSYLDQFAGVTFVPGVARITEHAYEVELGQIAAGETHRVTVELQAEQYWQHRGKVSAFVARDEAVEYMVQTLVFP